MDDLEKELIKANNKYHQEQIDKIVANATPEQLIKNLHVSRLVRNARFINKLEEEKTGVGFGNLYLGLWPFEKL